MTAGHVPFVDLKAQYRVLQDEIEPAVAEVLAGPVYDPTNERLKA